MKFFAIIRYYWPFVRAEWISQVVMLGNYGIGKVVGVTALPIAFKGIIDTVNEAPPDAASILWGYVWFLAIMYLVLNVTFRIGDYFYITAQSRILAKLTNYSLSKLQQHSYSFFTNTFTGSLIAKSKRFISSYETIQDQFVFMFWMGGVSLLATMIVLWWFSPVLGLAFLIWLFFYVVMVTFLVKWQIPKSLVYAEADSKVTGHFSDIISNFFTVMMFGTTLREEKEFALTVDDQEKKRRRAWMQHSFWNGMWQGININLSTLLFVAIGIWLWLDGAITAGTLLLVPLYAVSTFDTVWGISKSIIRVSTAFTDAAEMVEIFETPRDVQDTENPERLVIARGEIIFSKIHFTYEGTTKVFSGFDLHISAGEKVALVGHSGAGKTTITKLLLRFQDIESGDITIDGQSIRRVRQEALRSQIAYVPQEPLLFHRSLRENIAYARPEATLEEVRAVAKKARADEFIEKLPNGYETLVGERGIKLSGGERQRVAIARAMLKNAPIIMLDEATSALDSVSEQKIQEALWELIAGKTTIVIAHRLSTIQKMDRIIVFDAGNIVEQGTHTELLHHEGVYAHLWKSQVGGFIAD